MPAYRIPFEAMASACEVVVVAADEAAARQAAQPALDEVRRIEHSYSRYRPDSVVSRINAAAGRAWTECDTETGALLDYADHLYRLSDGLFDITSGVLRRAWNFREAALPVASDLASALSLVGWPGLERDGERVRLARAGMEIDFGGFGKEYAADRAADALAATGVAHGYVNLAGDMRIVGPRPDGTPWHMGIQHPRQRGELIATLPLERGGLATSGDYERFFELDGRRYCHVLHPRTGWPVTHWQSVSVVAPLAIVAGGLATIAMLKQQDAIAFLLGAGVDFLAVDHRGALHRSGDGAAADTAATRAQAPAPHTPLNT